MIGRPNGSRKLSILRFTPVATLPLFLAFGQGAHAADLRNFIGNLYGGQGIQLATPALVPGTIAAAGPGANTFTTANASTYTSVPLGTQASALKSNVSLTAGLAAPEGLVRLGTDIGSLVEFNSFNASIVSLTFDVTQGLPVRTVDSLGPIVGERADTLGEQRFTLGFSYTHLRYTKFNGAPLSHLLFSMDLNPASLDPTDLTKGSQGVQACITYTKINGSCHWISDTIQVNVNVHIEQDVFAFSGTYGITPDWDVGFILPIVDVTATASAVAAIDYHGSPDTITHQFLATSPYFQASDATFRDRSGGDATGIGDLVLRTKYNFLKNMEDLPDGAVIGQVRAPTGDERQLLGTGSTDFLGMLVLSKQLGAIAPHLNVGYEAASGGQDRSNLRYAAGADLRVAQDITLAADIFGRDEHKGQNLTDFAVGAKWSVFERGLLFGNVVIPVNGDTGLRSDYIWTIGGEIHF